VTFQFIRFLCSALTAMALMFADAVSSKLTDVLILGDGPQESQELAQAALGPGQRVPLQINAPLPEPIANSSRRRYNDMPPRQRVKLQRSAGAALTKAEGLQMCWQEALGSLFISS
jgi:hypothetical protein